MPQPEEIDAFIARWAASGGHERGAGHQFLLELCDLLDLDRPDPPVADNALNAYTFERRVERRKPDGTTAANWIDLYKAGCFVLETKQGVNARRDKSDPDQPLLELPGSQPTAKSAGHGTRGTAAFDKALERAWHQGSRYIQALPVEKGRPPFLIICDVGHSIELYAEFSGTGGQYERFPDPVSHRIRMTDLHRPEIRERLRAIWTDPHSLDPAKHSAAVTREVAKALADLAKSLEKDGHDPEITAGFLQRCLFTMFAEDVGLLPEQSFLELLKVTQNSPAGLPVMLQSLWKDMATGAKFSPSIRAAIPHFNGGLFEESTALPLRSDQIAYLIHAAKADWSAVEPAIFGTLLERALDVRERYKLGAHYTPRSYVERLVRPTVIEPLREQWEAVKTAAAQLDDHGDAKGARAAVADFHHDLCRIRILDPACGSGNFLYVSLELMKRLEAEVLDLLEKLGADRSLEMDTFKVRPDQFLGLEINERAVAIAQLVLWIGYFQWHRKTAGKADTGDRPLLPKNATIKQQDAVLAYDEKKPRQDPDTGDYVTIWDGRTTKPHPVTGKEVPDESSRALVFDYTNPRRAEWPAADYIVGNPPFIGKGRLLENLGDGYVEALRRAWKHHSPDGWDFVMFWWHQAAELVSQGGCLRFGLITTNSIHQTFNRRCIEPFLADEKKPVHLAFAIPDHPWVDSGDGADVRIAMSVVSAGSGEGFLNRVIEEKPTDDGEHEVTLSSERGFIAANFKLGANTASAVSMRANSGISCLGLILGGKGFKIPRELADTINKESLGSRKLAVPIWNGNDITDRWEGHYAIDAFGLSESELAKLSPTAWQHLKNTVYPVRQTNRDPKLRKLWWLFRRANTEFRTSTAGLDRFIVTSETAKHRVFRFLGGLDRPEHKLVVVAIADAAMVGLLSSSVHVTWSLATGSRLEDRPVYVKTTCFETFPFPDLAESPLKHQIRDLGERLDAHRKRQQELHSDLTLTGMYNVLEKLRRGEPLTDKDRKIHDDGLVTLLKQIHDELDTAVLEAYGWPDLATAIPLADRLATGDETLEQEILTRLVALNHERAAEEKRGLIRWLRPEYQAPDSAGLPKEEQREIELEAGQSAATPAAAAVTQAWPETLSAQVAAIQKLLPATGPDPSALATAFGKRTKSRIAKIAEILETLETLGKL